MLISHRDDVEVQPKPVHQNAQGWEVKGPLDVILVCENNIPEALQRLEAMIPAPLQPPQPKRCNRKDAATASSPEAKAVKDDLTAKELLNPVEEREIGENQFQFEGGEDEIIAAVQKELAIERGEVMEVDDSDSEDEDVPNVPNSELMALCEKLESVFPAGTSQVRSTLLLMDLIHEENVSPSDVDKEALEELLFNHPDPFHLAKAERINFTGSESDKPTVTRSQTTFAITEYIKLDSKTLAELIHPSKQSGSAGPQKDHSQLDGAPAGRPDDWLINDFLN
ncbi:hypothetical protein C8R45DRAFT_1109805 [Mycena sanguinolenta]|nr:hypothetical protein C8R45DRAFT_1109805 [Mycena sanguinolenta]